MILNTSMTCSYSFNLNGGIKQATTGFLLSLVSYVGAVKQSIQHFESLVTKGDNFCTSLHPFVSS